MTQPANQNLQTVKFITTTAATILSLDIKQGVGVYRPLTVNNGTATTSLPSGFSGVAILRIAGPIGTPAQFKVVQVISGVDVVLTERNFLKITAAEGQATANIDFIVR